MRARGGVADSKGGGEGKEDRRREKPLLDKCRAAKRRQHSSGLVNILEALNQLGSEELLPGQRDLEPKAV